VLVVVGVTALTWLAMRVLRPGWFAGDSRPVPAQLADYLRRDFLHLDFGRSWQPPQDRVATIIRRGLPADVSLLLGATAFGVAAGTAAGTYCAARPGRRSPARSTAPPRSSSSRRCTSSGCS
jgi:ABC-type dipeptide/oligopeptide/nickel transport system permease component